MNNKYLAEGSIAFDQNNSDYSLPGQRIYLSRLVVKEDYRNEGIGSIMIDFLINKAVEMRYEEISIGVEKKNTGALRLYKRKGFDEIIFEGEDEYGLYFKLLKN